MCRVPRFTGPRDPLHHCEPMSHQNQRGDSLIEIIFAIVVIGLVVSAIVGAITTSENGTSSHRELVTADAVLRNYAETVKSAVRSTCTSAGATWSATYSEAGYPVNSLAGQPCPAVTTTATATLQVSTPSGVTKSMTIAVRTP